MSVEPVMQERIVEKMLGAATQDLIEPTCCYKTCRKAAKFLLILRFKTGTTDVYGLCNEDKIRLMQKEAITFGRTQKQGIFLYPARGL